MKNYKIDYNADGDWRDINGTLLKLWYVMHVKGNEDYPTYECWLADMIKMDLIKEV